MARKATTLSTREKRLQAIGAYLGPPGPLLAEFAAGEIPQRIRTFAQAAPDDILAALSVLNGIDGAATVVHGPAGCVAAQAHAAPDGHWAVTGLDQRDTILGADAALSRTILTLYRRHTPWVIFIVMTPVVAINNDDARSAADSLSAELGIPIIVLRTDGFHSRIAATGFDAAAQALLALVPASNNGTNDDLVNLVTGPHALAGAAELSAVLAELGLQTTILPRGAGAADFARAAQARLSVSLDADAGDAFAAGLQKAHGVPFLHNPAPIGLEATGAWLRAVGDATGRGYAADRLHATRLAALPQDTLDRPLDGLRVHLALDPNAALSAAALVAELGGTVGTLTVDHLDTATAERLHVVADQHPGLILHVASSHPFEDAGVLASGQRPDLFVGTPERAALAASAGIPTVSLRADALIGYRGAAHLARQARKALRNPAFIARIAARPSVYAASWFKRSADWHIKQEVR